MIITTQKPLDEIQRMLKSYSKLFVIGCGTCSTTCQTGGEEEVKEMIKKLDDKNILGTMVVESPCDARLLKRDARKHKKEIADADAVLCLACGAGVQNIVEKIEKVCVPALNTKFIGRIERIGEFYERCRACGDCILFDTGGICPIVRCPKGMLNGPCGGMFDSNCEVGGYERDCAWVLIYERLKNLGLLEFIEDYKEPRDNSQLNVEPREVVWIKR